jgi:chromate transporter
MTLEIILRDFWPSGMIALPIMPDFVGRRVAHQQGQSAILRVDDHEHGITLPRLHGIFDLRRRVTRIVLSSAAAIGYLGGKWKRDKFLVIRGHGKANAESVLDDTSAVPDHAKPAWPRALRVVLIWVILWSAPVLLLTFWLGSNHTVVQEGIFFSKAALVTFGGAYAVLPYVAQQAVQTHRWLSAGQMLDGLGLAETTPGPLIMVTQFVGFLGGWNHPGPLPPIAAATLGALVTTWTTFTPCFLWIFLGGPYIEKLRGNEALTTALSAVTAAVVGVVLNLAVWFGLHVIFPGNGMVDWFAIVVGTVTFIGMVRWKWDIVPVVLGAGFAGLIFRMFFGYSH